MEVLKSASDALQRYFSFVAMYVAVYVVLGLLGSALDIVRLLQNTTPDAGPTLAAHLLTVLWFVVYSAVAAAVQCAAFSRMGREIDRPLWKVRDDREAFQRFYTMWFEFNLVVNTVWWIANTRLGGPDSEALNIVAAVLALALVVVVVPFGACQMFFGSFSWPTFGEALGAMARRPGDFVPVFFITFLQFVLAVYIGVLSQPDGKGTSELALFVGARLATDVAVAYLDCLAFAATWLVCKDDRDSPNEIDLDF